MAKKADKPQNPAPEKESGSPIDSEVTKVTMDEETVSSDSVQAEAGSPEESGVPARLLTEADARAFVKARYSVPEGNKVVLVTSDFNVFWEANEGAAVNHSQRQNLKLFRLVWD